MTPAAAPSHDKTVRRLRETFDSGVTRPIKWRQQQLDGLLRLIDEQQHRLAGALAADLGRPGLEAWIADLRTSALEVEHTKRHLRRWMADERVRPPWQFALTKSKIRREPLGVALIIAPWNYPIYLLLAPLAGALGAGNTVALKPSELTPTVSSALAELLPRYLDPEAVAVIEGGPEETTALLEERFDHILYTGGGRIGRVVMAAAARHLTPVTLELGGKSPVIIAADAHIKAAATRIAFGKFLNAGQTCVAPDYVLVDRRVEHRFVDELTNRISKFYGSDAAQSESFGRIVNERHFDRIVGVLDGGGYDAIATGGERDRATKFIAPTVLTGVSADAPVMTEEIFGPVLPVLAVDDVSEAIAFVNDRDKPLALYVFTSDDHTADRVLNETSSGGACVNDVAFHLLVPNLPFGGVGESGMGAYHGRSGFETFSHRKAVFERPTWLDLPFLLPPYTKLKERLVRRLF